MKSSGGVTSTSSAKREPIQTVLSGPAAGVIGASNAAKLAGYPNVITIDIGGTSADVCVIQQGEHAVTGRGRIGDWPLNTPMIDITTIGAGGGSMARVTPEGQLLVGPASAGSVPGPVCYGKGGEQPTVTDANLVLGRLCPSLLNDDFILDIKSAESAIKRKIADPLGLTVTQAAQGILDIVDHSMVGALRLVTVERGLDPRDFALLPFGGAGPVHGSSLARLLGINTQVIAAHPGVLSAYGLLNADLRSDFSRTFFCSDPFKSLNDIKQVFSELENQATDWFFRESVPLRQQNRSWAASFRYAHQGFELTVPWDDSKKTVASLENVIHSFHALHEKLYTFNQLDTPVELVTLHVTATAAFKRPAEQTNAKSSRKPPEILGKQKMYADKKWHVAPIYHRSKLHPGSKFEGPAIIKQLDTTTVVLPGQLVKAHPSGALIIKEV
jgi:N-methylhydantoinase A